MARFIHFYVSAFDSNVTGAFCKTKHGSSEHKREKKQQLCRRPGICTVIDSLEDLPSGVHEARAHIKTLNVVLLNVKMKLITAPINFSNERYHLVKWTASD